MQHQTEDAVVAGAAAILANQVEIGNIRGGDGAPPDARAFAQFERWARSGLM